MLTPDELAHFQQRMEAVLADVQRTLGMAAANDTGSVAAKPRGECDDTNQCCSEIALAVQAAAGAFPEHSSCLRSL